MVTACASLWPADADRARPRRPNRLIDGVAFLAFAAAVIVFVGAPQAEGIGTGLMAAAAGSAVIFASLVVLLALFRRTVRAGGAGVRRLVAWVPGRLRGNAHTILEAPAEGGAWPRSPARAAAIALLALCVKALAVTHLLWAGLALGVWLGIAQYVLLMVALGFVHVLSRYVRIPGGFLLAAAFLLELLGVDRERALAMLRCRARAMSARHFKFQRGPELRDDTCSPCIARVSLIPSKPFWPQAYPIGRSQSSTASSGTRAIWLCGSRRGSAGMLMG